MVVDCSLLASARRPRKAACSSFQLMCSGDSDFRQWPETVFPDLTAPQPVEDAPNVIVIRGAVSVLPVGIDMLTSLGDRVVHQCRSSDAQIVILA